MQNIALDERLCNHTDEPDYIVIHSATAVQINPWDDWARSARDLLIENGWTQRRLGRSLHMVHRLFAGGVA